MNHNSRTYITPMHACIVSIITDLNILAWSFVLHRIHAIDSICKASLTVYFLQHWLLHRESIRYPLMDMEKHVMNSNYEMTKIETSCENIVLQCQRRARDISYTAIIAMPVNLGWNSYLVIFLVYLWIQLAPVACSLQYISCESGLVNSIQQSCLIRRHHGFV